MVYLYICHACLRPTAILAECRIFVRTLPLHRHVRLVFYEQKCVALFEFSVSVISSGSMHWINDLPGVMRRVMNTLSPDGVFLGSLLGGEILFELRSALQVAEQALEDGFGPHISPMINMPDMGRYLEIFIDEYSVFISICPQFIFQSSQ